MPVYNTARYLERCITSVLRQKCSLLYELLLIDDGSNDGSSEICDEFARRYTNIRVMHQKNQGAAASRNKGIEYAAGEYLLFLDSDDFYASEDALELLYQEAVQEQADMVCFQYCRVNEENETFQEQYRKMPEQKKAGDKEEVVPELIRLGLYTSSSCLKMIRRKLLLEHGIRFAEGCRCEDIEFSLKILVCANGIIYLPDIFYSYFVRNGSTTALVQPETIRDMLVCIDSMCEYLKTEKNKILFRNYMSYVAFQYCTLLVNLHLAKPAVEKRVRNEVYRRKKLLKYRENYIVALVGKCCKIFGVCITGYMLYLYYQFRKDR